MKNRPVINADTFERIFSDNEDVLAKMAASISKLKYEDLENNITCNVNNYKNVRYIMTMPDDDLFVIKDLKENDDILIYLKKD